MDAPICDSGNDYNGNMGLRVSSIFIIFLGSALGAIFPVYAATHCSTIVTKWAFFIAKYFGSGVIVATAFIHLLTPAHEALTNPCLTGPITEYSWVEGICLTSVFLLFWVELMTMRFAKFGHSHDHSNEYALHVEVSGSDTPVKDPKYTDEANTAEPSSMAQSIAAARQIDSISRGDSHCPASPYVPGDDHLSHAREHRSNPGREHDLSQKTFDPESYAAQMTALFILEFGVIFHSFLIGLTLAVAGPEFVTLYVVLSFHQTFEGLALGSRLGSIEWPKRKRFTPYLLALGYAVSTPIAIAIGLGVRKSFKPGSQTNLIVTGIFDSFSAGILIYTGLVELMAHEFMFSATMQSAPIVEVLTAVGCMALGALLMALLGKWA